MSLLKITTEPFTCPSCVTKIETALTRLAGVERATVMFNAGRVHVDFDTAAIDAATIADTVARLGYPVLATKVS